jgi:hypothetical protein
VGDPRTPFGDGPQSTALATSCTARETSARAAEIDASDCDNSASDARSSEFSRRNLVASEAEAASSSPWPFPSPAQQSTSLARALAFPETLNPVFVRIRIAPTLAVQNGIAKRGEDANASILEFRRTCTSAHSISSEIPLIHTRRRARTQRLTACHASQSLLRNPAHHHHPKPEFGAAKWHSGATTGNHMIFLELSLGMQRR